ncbi:hypothetical protein VKS41_008680 [Umbelopsis sp. WA50703]
MLDQHKYINDGRIRQWLQQIIIQEWEKFRQENEAALRLETDDLESAIEENLLEELQGAKSYDPTWDEFMQLEEDAMAEAFENYQQQKALVQPSAGNRIASDASEEYHQQLCFGCNKGVFQVSASDNPSVWQCPNCQLHHDENSVAEDSALKTMLAGMLQLAHAALNENDEDKKQELYITWLTAFELIIDQAAEQSTASQLHVLQTLEAVLLSDELGMEQERVREHDKIHIA